MSERAFVDNEATHVFVRELDRRYPLIVARRGRLARGRRRHALPRRGQRRRDGRRASARASRGDRGGRGQADADLASSTTSSSRARRRRRWRRSSPASRPRRLRSRALRDRRRRGERDGAAARPPYHVERGEPGRDAIVSPAQAYHGPTMATLGADRPAGAAAAATSRSRRRTSTAAVDVALRPERPGRPRRRSTARSRGRAPDRRRLLLRAGLRGGAARRTPRPTRSGTASPSDASGTAS